MGSDVKKANYTINEKTLNIYTYHVLNYIYCLLGCSIFFKHNSDLATIPWLLHLVYENIFFIKTKGYSEQLRKLGVHWG